MVDLPTLSSFPPNPIHDRDVNAGINSTWQVLNELASAAGPYCKKYFIPGNHEQRMFRYIVKHSPELFNLQRAQETSKVLSIEYLLRLDELGYEFVAGEFNDWPDAKLQIAPDLYVKHGWFSRRGSGNTARAAIEELGASLILGHIHKGAKVYVTKPLQGKTYEGIETPTMCQIEGGLGFAVEPNWQNGFVVVRVFENGDYCADPIRFANGKLLYNTLI